MKTIAAAGIACLLVCRTTATAAAPPPAPAAPAATPFPNFDIAKSCHTISDMQGCKTDEEQAKHALKTKWSEMSDVKKAECKARGAQVTPGGSYVAALSCARRP